jgi:hypothetical protein
MECPDWNTPQLIFMKKSGKVLRDWYVVQMDEAGVENLLRIK